VLDRIADPGNVGTIIRTAAAFGADAVVALTGCADVWSGKVVRSTAGAFAEVQILSNISENEFLSWSNKQAIRTFALAGQGTQFLGSVDLASPHIWIVGNEAGGITNSLISASTNSIRIPMEPNIESLNAAMALGICAFSSFTALNK
jgi:TrmH family RNA methyltransferase